jgi:hypothetical protein
MATRFAAVFVGVVGILVGLFGLSKHSSDSSSLLSPFPPSLMEPKDIEHIVLLGDSILDNIFYVRKTGRSVHAQLQEKIASRGWKSTLCAVDGNVMAHIPQQLRRVPADATYFVLSIGGNDCLRALASIENFYNPFHLGSVLFSFLHQFRIEYAATLQLLKEKNVPFCVCNIYYPRFTDWKMKHLSSIGLWFVNGIIEDEARKLGVPLIDIATIFDQDQDYANPIEPGVPGGDKLTNNIVQVVSEKPNGFKIYRLKEYSSPRTPITQETREKEPEPMEPPSIQNEPFRSM